MKSHALIACSALFLLGLASPGVSAADEQPENLTLEILMQRFASSRGVVATFHEHKELELLSDPVESRGRLYIVPPDRMVRITTAPQPSTLVIDHDELVFEDELGREEMDLRSQPAARQFVDHMLVLFRGDLALMRKRYELQFDSAGATWTLEITPRTNPLKQLIASIALEGEGPKLRKMVILELNGDRTVTTYPEIATDYAFGDAELAELFGRKTDDASKRSP